MNNFMHASIKCILQISTHLKLEFRSTKLKTRHQDWFKKQGISRYNNKMSTIPSSPKQGQVETRAWPSSEKETHIRAGSPLEPWVSATNFTTTRTPLDWDCGGLEPQSMVNFARDREREQEDRLSRERGIDCLERESEETGNPRSGFDEISP